MYLTHALAFLSRRNMANTLSAVSVHLRRASCYRMVVLAILAACIRTPPLPPTLPEAPVLQPSPPVLPNTTVRKLQSETATFLLTSTIVTTELTARPITRDSLVLRETVLAQLVPHPSSQSLSLEFRSDSGYTLPHDRTLPPETISTAPQPAHVAARLSWTTNSVVLDHSSLSSSCPTISTLLSDLIPILFTRYILLHQTTAQYPDSIQYISCTGTISVSNTLLFHQASPDSLTTSFQVISTSDSSRALPMHMQGTTLGKATVVPQSGTTVLPSALILTSTLSLTAKSSKRQQQFRQIVFLELAKQ